MPFDLINDLEGKFRRSGRSHGRGRYKPGHIPEYKEKGGFRHERRRHKGRLIKGSRAAKAYMAKIRRMRKR